jgi:hypothetical protein
MSVLDIQCLYRLGELKLCSWYSDEATGWMASGMNSSRSKRFFCPPNHPWTLGPVMPRIQQVLGFFPGIKAAGT